MKPLRTMGLVLLLATWCALAASAAAPARHGTARTPDPPRVESFVLEAVDTLNDRIVAAAHAHESWTKDALQVALQATNESAANARSLDLHFEGNRSEASDSAVVIVVADGYADDSIRGSWIRLALARSADGTWRLLELRRAWRCQRGHHLQNYSKELCP